MSWLSRILNRRKSANKSSDSSSRMYTPEYQALLNINSIIEDLLNADNYIAKSEYKDKLLESSNTIEFFDMLIKTNQLKDYCNKNDISTSFCESILSKYKNIESLVDKHNDDFISRTLIHEKQYLDNILRDVDPKINLDDDQRRVILTDEDYCLVIAGAGAGKTTTVAAKVKYLVEKKNIDPKQILVVSFTNKAVQELRDKLNIDLKIPCPISTFHAVGNAIIRKQTPEKLNIVDSSKLYFVLQDYFKSNLLQNESMVKNIINFFATYIDAPFEGNDINDFFNKIAKSNFSTLKSDLNEYNKEIIDSRSKRSVTIQSEMLRSKQEVEIANFLYLNSIEYEYEPVYPYNILMSKKPYTPDFIIYQGDKTAYIEHFGIIQSGENKLFSEDQLNAYKKAINDKITLHRKHGTTLIYTFSKYNDGKSAIDHLKDELIAKGFELHPRDDKDIIKKLVIAEESRYIRKLVSLVTRFISNFKTNGYTVSEFDRMYHSTQNVRSKIFINICHECYLEYERYLRENNAVDFQDMINESARLLREVENMNQLLDFKYIIVDEYQDISRQRFDLVTTLSKVTKAKIIAVGDDWQSIYAFSGSDITLFTNFAEKMGYAKMLKITNTYRNSQEVIDIAGNFIQKNISQIPKSLKSPKTITDPVIIYTYDGTYKKPNENNRSGANYALAHAVQTAIEQILEYNKAEGKPRNSSILLLGRFGFDGDKLEKSGLFEYIDRNRTIKSVKYPNLNITLMTAHASKGLGYDNVIVINGRNEIYGFPSKIEDDPVLSFVVKEDKSYDYAEERRLFYVAMTRTKNRVFFVAPEQNPSEFLLELKRDYKNIVLRGNWNEASAQNNIFRKKCPICGFPLQFKYKPSYGLRLYICTNEPEICGFMTNEYNAGKLSILKCDKCVDGYLVARKGTDGGYFLGCTNYSNNGKGCNNSIHKEAYYKMFDLTSDSNFNIPIKSIDKPPIITTQKTIAPPVNNIVELKSSPLPTKQASENNKTIVIEKPVLESIVFNAIDLGYVVHTILQCLSNVSATRYYGTHLLADVLRGSQSKQVISNKLFDIPEYNALAIMRRDDLLLVIEWLIEKHYILQTKHPKYPVLHPTYEGIHYSETITTKDLEKLCKLLHENRIT